MEGHEERGQELEYELSEMEERSDALAEDIEGAKDDWAQKKQDAAVPGARGEAGDEPPGEAEGDEDEDDQSEPEAE
jgi:hypothetical protein